MICGRRSIPYSFDELVSNITPILDFGKKVKENYEDVKTKLSRCKRFYHNGKRSRTYEYGRSDSSDD